MLSTPCHTHLDNQKTLASALGDGLFLQRKQNMSSREIPVGLCFCCEWNHSRTGTCSLPWQLFFIFFLNEGEATYFQLNPYRKNWETKSQSESLLQKFSQSWTHFPLTFNSVITHFKIIYKSKSRWNHPDYHYYLIRTICDCHENFSAAVKNI